MMTIAVVKESKDQETRGALTPAGAFLHMVADLTMARGFQDAVEHLTNAWTGGETHGVQRVPRELWLHETVRCQRGNDLVLGDVGRWA